ncbi:NF-X1-type zinc finger protein NFXL1 [Lamellibrachia satsuma]|nr:NF-X1-type zinc finger protein NFXL1 [Lamellibrachia satsuma]
MKSADSGLGGNSTSPKVSYSKVTGMQHVTAQVMQPDNGDRLDVNNVSKKSAEQRFQDVASKHQESVQRHLQNVDDEYESSDEEEDMNDDDILETVLKSFRGSTGSDGQNDLGRTHEYLVNSMKSKANTCLICIETIKRMDAVWSCQGCHAMLHISCIQKWVRDGVYQRTAFSEENIPERDLPWFCPKCRHEYKQMECPTRYYCFCGKEEDPQFDPWLVPHSCGQVCGRRLKPDCGHSCLLLCHPGPCPPCPQTVRATCYCGRQSPQIRRCGAREWTCGQPCNKPLTCGHHCCGQPCHKGDCPACPETSLQSCQCGRSSCVRPCASQSWQCDQVCGEPLSCGHHTCEKVCHGGECGTCPRAGLRTCPCGKTSFQLPCTKDAPTCLSTCDKLLDCSQHQCTQRCHTGPCGTCRQMTQKTCRCGQKTKQVPCFKEFLCETRCTRMKNCGKHVCKRKCCDGHCPSCEQPCGRTLGCRNHKCASRCHTGPCYPCPLTVTISYYRFIFSKLSGPRARGPRAYPSLARGYGPGLGLKLAGRAGPGPNIHSLGRAWAGPGPKF